MGVTLKNDMATPTHSSFRSVARCSQAEGLRDCWRALRAVIVISTVSLLP